MFSSQTCGVSPAEMKSTVSGCDVDDELVGTDAVEAGQLVVRNLAAATCDPTGMRETDDAALRLAQRRIGSVTSASPRAASCRIVLIFQAKQHE